MLAKSVLDDGKAFLNKISKSEIPLGVVGDLCLDRFIFGSVDRISPEAPVPVLLQDREEERLGCTANICANIQALSTHLNVHQYLFSIVGDDDLGKSLLHQLKTLNPKMNLQVLSDSSRPTTLKTRFLAGNQHQLLRVDSESQKSLSPELEKKFLDNIAKGLDHFKFLIVQDYAKGLLSPVVLQSILSMAKSKGVFTIVDPHRKTPASSYRGASLIKPNIQEAEVLLGEQFSFDKGRDSDRVAEGARLIKKNLQVDNVLITRSAYGMTLLDQSNQITHFPALARSVFDVTGAGDTTVAVLSTFLAAGAPLALSISLAVAASSVVVAKVGTATATIQEILTELLQTP